MKKLLLGLVGGALLIAGFALAQVPGAKYITSLSGAYSLGINTPGPQSAIVPLNAGTFTCNGASTVTVTAPKVAAGSFILYTLKTVGGTVGAIPTVLTTTAGTGFTLKCTGGDTSIYTYFILG